MKLVTKLIFKTDKLTTITHADSFLHVPVYGDELV